MDESQFDRLTRRLGSYTSRRTMLKSMLGIGGTLVAGSALTSDGAEAARRGFSGPTLPELPPPPPPPSCPDQQIWDGSGCVCTSGVPCGSICCDSGTVCSDEACVIPPPTCPDGQIWDGSACDCIAGTTCGMHCCAENQICSAGFCETPPSTCPDGQTWNGSICVCTAGITCGARCCDAGQVCSAGSCETPPPPCPDGQTWDETECICNSGMTCGSHCCSPGTTCSNDECVTPTICMGYQDPCTTTDDCCNRLICLSGTCFASGGGGCFTGETRIAMANGTSRAIADIATGDLVIGDDGHINSVVGIDRLTLEDRLLYALDDSIPFVTASHPFMTEDGWKAVDPTRSWHDHRLPAVGLLANGDRLVRLAGILATAGTGRAERVAPHVEIQTEPATVVSLAGVAAPASTQLYNLRLDGNNTYFANELLVHNKYYIARPVDDMRIVG